MRKPWSVASGSVPTCPEILVGGRDLAARARLDELDRDATDGKRIDVILAKGSSPASTRFGRKRFIGNAGVPLAASRALRSASEDSAMTSNG